MIKSFARYRVFNKNSRIRSTLIHKLLQSELQCGKCEISALTNLFKSSVKSTFSRNIFQVNVNLIFFFFLHSARFIIFFMKHSLFHYCNVVCVLHVYQTKIEAIYGSNYRNYVKQKSRKKAAYNFFETLLCTTSVMKLSPIRALFIE